MAGRIRFNEPRRLSRQKAESYLAELRLEDLALRPLNALSGGQRQQVSLAALLAQEAKFAWLDEPANHLDPARRREGLGRVRDRSHAHGMGVVVVTHDVSLLTAMGEELQVLGLKKGRQAFRCTVNDADLSEQLSELYERPVRAGQRPDLEREPRRRIEHHSHVPRRVRRVRARPDNPPRVVDRERRRHPRSQLRHLQLTQNFDFKIICSNLIPITLNYTYLYRSHQNKQFGT